MLFELDHQNCSVRDFQVVESSIQQVRPFIQQWHYSHSAESLKAKHVFSLVHENDLIGAMVYGDLAMVGQWKRYREFGVEKESDLIELRRLCCIDDTPRNTESFFIGRTIKWLKKNTDIKLIVSYADPHHGHAGTIYKASNFKHVGESSPGKIIDWNGKRYHDKSIRNYKREIIDGKSVSTGVLTESSIRLKEALESGEAVMHKTPGKHIYIYKLRG